MMREITPLKVVATVFHQNTLQEVQALALQVWEGDRLGSTPKPIFLVVVTAGTLMGRLFSVDSELVVITTDQLHILERNAA